MLVLNGKVALVTGSSRGIGAVIAQTLAVNGATVAVHGRDAKAVRRISEGIERDGGRAIAVTADVTRFADIESMRKTIEESLGPIDILVANVGASLTPPHAVVEELDEAGWRASLDANLSATFLTLKAVLPGMKARRRGTITTVSSAAARRPTAKSPAPYAAAKAGIQVLTQIVAAQAGPYGIRVNCVAPETILTERSSAQMPTALQAQMAAEHPVPRLGTPYDVAQAVLYLVSDASAWITGIVLDVAGGSVLR